MIVEINEIGTNNSKEVCQIVEEDLTKRRAQKEILLQKEQKQQELEAQQRKQERLCRDLQDCGMSLEVIEVLKKMKAGEEMYFRDQILKIYIRNLQLESQWEFDNSPIRELERNQ